MVVKMMKWRPWPPLSYKKYEVKIMVQKLEGLNVLLSRVHQGYARVALEVKWKGSKGNALSLRSFKKSIIRNFTKEEPLRQGGVVEWDEEFLNVCNFASYKDGAFHPWKVAFTVFNVSNQGQNDKIPVIATASLNLASFVSATDQKEIEVSIPMQTSSFNSEIQSSLSLSLSFIERKMAREPSEVVQTMVMSIPPASPSIGEISSPEKDLKTTLRKVQIFRRISTRRLKKESHEEESSDGKSSVRSEDAQYIYPLDTDSLEDTDEGESEEGKDSNIEKSFSYGTLADVNHTGTLFYSNGSSSEDEDLVYYTNKITDSGNSYKDTTTTSILEHASHQSPIHKILPWRKRKLGFRSSKAKAEPLLKKCYGDEGGDDIDHDRRQLTSSDESNFGLLIAEENQPSVSQFGEDSFAVGRWEQKELLSRDGHLKLQAEVFFSSIDQRSERAAGESACTALVAVIADWFQSNRDEMPIKSQLDSLIREGSLEWRNLCENETYRERFPDKHFDLETVLQAKIRPLSVVSEKSFIGFFHPEGIEEGEFDFLEGAMSFDSIWDEISQSVPDDTSTTTTTEPVIYIVSWNDHFFILKVEQDAYYIIDTLGERLFEGCNQAFILKFDRETAIHRVPTETKGSDGKPTTTTTTTTTTTRGKVTDTKGEGEMVVAKNEDESTVLCKGKESCKEYIKSFLAAIPIRELQVDLKKGLMASTPLHRRLQIEFHYTKSVHPQEGDDKAMKVLTMAAAAAVQENCG